MYACVRKLGKSPACGHLCNGENHDSPLELRVLHFQINQYTIVYIYIHTYIYIYIYLIYVYIYIHSHIQPYWLYFMAISWGFYRDFMGFYWGIAWFFTAPAIFIIPEWPNLTSVVAIDYMYGNQQKPTRKLSLVKQNFTFVFLGWRLPHN